MNKKEIIDEVIVSDRTSSMTNPRTNESLRAVGADGEDASQGGGMLWLFQKDKGVTPLRTSQHYTCGWMIYSTLKCINCFSTWVEF